MFPHLGHLFTSADRITQALQTVHPGQFSEGKRDYRTHYHRSRRHAVMPEIGRGGWLINTKSWRVAGVGRAGVKGLNLTPLCVDFIV